MWNLLSIVREMYKRNDRNSLPLLEIVTLQCLETAQIMIWWFNTKVGYKTEATQEKNICLSEPPYSHHYYLGPVTCDRLHSSTSPFLPDLIYLLNKIHYFFKFQKWSCLIHIYRGKTKYRISTTYRII